VADARDIVEDLTEAGVKLTIGGSIHDPTDPVGRLLFNVLAMIAEFESDLIKMRTREGHEGRQGQGQVARQAAQAQAGPGGARTWLNCGEPVGTPARNSPNCSPSPVPPSTARSSVPASRSRHGRTARDSRTSSTRPRTATTQR
jgi:hypothetical protein